MPLASLNLFLKPRSLVVRWRNRMLRVFLGIDIDLSVNASLSSRFRSRKRGLITVGPETLIAFKTLIYSYDSLTDTDRPVRIGRRCFVGGGSIVMPGVTIGDGSIVGAGAVVQDDVPPATIVGGNPARVLRSNITVGPFGRLEGADDNSRRLWLSE